MKVNLIDIPENKSIDDYADSTEFVLSEKSPRYLLEPFEMIMPEDERYENALTREQVLQMK